MATWEEIEAAAPALVARARAYFNAHTHLTLATLRRDGAPRISGTECIFAEGELWFGSMPGSMKGRDLLRDGRFALHSGSIDPPDWEGDAKVAGVATDVDDDEMKARIVGGEKPPGPFNLFRCDIMELSVVALNDARNALVIESWHPDRGVTRIERE